MKAGMSIPTTAHHSCNVTLFRHEAAAPGALPTQGGRQ